VSPFDEPGAVAPSWMREIPLAHRGLHGGGVPENSLPAFAAAVEAGYGAELDVRLSADDVPVVVHDATLERVAGHDGAVAELTVDELAELRLDGTDEHVPTLRQALDVLGDHPVMVELKTNRLRAGPLERAIADIVAGHAGPLCIASFNPVPLRWWRRHQPETLRVQTAMADGISGLSTPLLRRLADLRELQSVAPAMVSYHIHGLPRAAVDAWRERGGLVTTWTVDDEQALAKARTVADNVIFEHVRPPIPMR